MNIKQACKLCNSHVFYIDQHWYAGNGFLALDGAYIVSTNVILEPGYNVNAGCTPDPFNPSKICVTVTQYLLNIQDDYAIEFAIAHELGHFFASRLLTNIGYENASGPITEIAADLGAAQLLLARGVSPDKVLAVATAGHQSGIFDLNWSGDHPSAAMRKEVIASFLKSRSKNDERFKDTLKTLTSRWRGVSSPDSLRHGQVTRTRSRN